MHRSSHFLTIMLDKIGPSRALNVNQNAGHGILQLNHDNGLQITQLVPVRKEISGKSAPRSVRNRTYAFFVRIRFPITMEPHHIELRTSLFNFRSTSAVVLPSFPDVVFEIFWHRWMLFNSGDVEIRHRHPTVNPVQF